jgi:phosphatidylserine/phosphatidylglycerophosphate/cardiolipin synthase-like enzyme
MNFDDWFLTSEERGNPLTAIDSHYPGGTAWTEGNHVNFLVDGISYFTRLAESISNLERDDQIRLADWRGDADEVVSSNGESIAALLANSCRRGVDVRGLLWRSHSDLSGFNSQQNRRLADDVNEAGGEVLLDERERGSRSHGARDGFALRGRRVLDVREPCGSVTWSQRSS